VHKQVKPRNGLVKRILVFFGGVDADNYTGRVIAMLSEIGMTEIHVDVVIGSHHPNGEEVIADCTKYEFNCHVQTGKMAKLMASSDFSIGAGGSTTWERCCLGLPSLSICLAENQSKQIMDAAKNGLIYAPEFDEELMIAINNHTIALLENAYLREFISRRAMRFVDGLGVQQIIGELGCSGIEIRMANTDDLLSLFNWRNHSSIRAVSKNLETISWEEHQKWFKNVINSNEQVLLLGENNEDPIGVVRFDKHAEFSEVSIYLVPDANNSGQGKNLLSSAELWIKEKCPVITGIRASVLGHNVQSQQMFISSNYQIETTHYFKQLK
jgi:UDP-2,4-diacetamido-2,4,6-trideoxy-beta-L-altropyranose hydrolase